MKKFVLGMGVITAGFASYVGYVIHSLDDETQAYARGMATASIGQIEEAEELVSKHLAHLRNEGLLVDAAWMSLYLADMGTQAGLFQRSLDNFDSVAVRAFGEAGESLPCNYYVRRCQAYLFLDPVKYADDVHRDALLALQGASPERELNAHFCGGNCYSYAHYALFLSTYYRGDIEGASKMVDEGVRALIHPIDRPAFDKVVEIMQ